MHAYDVVWMHLMVSVSWPNRLQAITTLAISLSSDAYTGIYLGNTSFTFNVHLRWPVKRITFSKAPLSLYIQVPIVPCILLDPMLATMQQTRKCITNSRGVHCNERHKILDFHMIRGCTIIVAYWIPSNNLQTSKLSVCLAWSSIYLTYILSEVCSSITIIVL